MIVRTIPFWKIPVKVYLNGWPKSGLHLAEQMASQFLDPMETEWNSNPPWNGILRDNSWSFRPCKRKKFHLARFAQIQPCHYFKGHAPHEKELEEHLERCGYSMFFVLRDLRDVAVSKAHQMQGEHAFPGRGHWRRMDFGDVLLAAIEGRGWFPDLVTHWAGWAPWLDVDWVCPLRFKDLRYNTRDTAKKMLAYVVERTSSVMEMQLGLEGEQALEIVENMVEASRRREESSTFRRGEGGVWKEHFEKRHRDAFAELGGNEWLIELGYEQEGYDIRRQDAEDATGVD